jgi:GxxExxY protein
MAVAKWEINPLSREIINAAIKVHTVLGPGLLESAYQGCLVHELRNRGLRVATEVELPVFYEGAKIDVGYRLDIVVEELIILELKSVDRLIPIHTAQLLSYLKLSGKQLGLLLNFNVMRMKDGIKRVVHGLEE